MVSVRPEQKTKALHSQNLLCILDTRGQLEVVFSGEQFQLWQVHVQVLGELPNWQKGVDHIQGRMRIRRRQSG